MRQNSWTANEVDGPLVIGHAANFLRAAGFQLAPPVQAHQEQDLHDIVYEDELDAEDGGMIHVALLYASSMLFQISA